MGQDGKFHARPDEELLDVVPMYLEKRKKDALEMGRLIDQKEFDRLREMSHKIKGNGSSYGFDELSQYAATLEQAAKVSDEAECRKWIEKIDYYLNHVEVEGL